MKATRKLTATYVIEMTEEEAIALRNAIEVVLTFTPRRAAPGTVDAFHAMLFDATTEAPE